MKPLKALCALGAAVALVLGSALPAHATVTLDQGHVDAAWIKYTSGSLQLLIGDHTSGSLVERNQADVVLSAKPASQKTVPNPANPACLGTPGSSVWILPQIQNPSLLWLGWNAESISSGVLDGNVVTLKLKSVTPPVAGAGFCVYSVSTFGTPTVLFNSLDGLPDSVAVPTGPTGHRHVNWVFKATGTWTVTLEVTATAGGVAKSSGDKTYTFSVG
jgi:surface-anchored protein